MISVYISCHKKTSFSQNFLHGNRAKKNISSYSAGFNLSFAICLGLFRFIICIFDGMKWCDKDADSKLPHYFLLEKTSILCIDSSEYLISRFQKLFIHIYCCYNYHNVLNYSLLIAITCYFCTTVPNQTNNRGLVIIGYKHSNKVKIIQI